MLKCASFFVGVGGIDLGFQMAGAETVYANDFDKDAVITFNLNSKIKADCRDICEVKAEEVPPFDILLAGFPCQAFSIAGYRQGFNDEKGRGNLFFELVRFIELHSPQVLFLENVKNLHTHDKGNTFRVIKETIEGLGYAIRYKVLNAMEYGNVPQNRERIYIIAFKDKEKRFRFKMPEPITRTKNLSDIIDFSGEQDSRLYYTDKCPFFEKLKEEIRSQKTIYQWRRQYVRENKNGVVPTLTANMGTGGHNVPLILCDDGRIRKLSPRECFNAQGFPESFMLPDLAYSKLYKQAGNSVSVPVIANIAKKIMDILEM